MSLTSIGMAGQKPQWEAGVSGIEFQTPHYLGSNHAYRFGFALPLFIYRAEFLDAGGGNKLLLWDSDWFTLDFSGSGRFPVESADVDDPPPDNVEKAGAELIRNKNYTRRGMDDLPFTVFLGPQIKFFIGEHISLRVPYLPGVTLGEGFETVGTLLQPGVVVDVFEKESNHSWDWSVSWVHGDENYNDYYYGVRSKDILEDRSEFDADAGLVAVIYGMSFRVDITERLSVFGGYFVQDMQESIVRDSPLVVSPVSRSFLYGIAYSFAQSSTSVKTWK